jgi:hypothetical protein
MRIFLCRAIDAIPMTLPDHEVLPTNRDVVDR